MNRPLAPLLTALLAGLLALAPVGALAHDELLTSEPADGATVEAPDELVLHFSGDMSQVGAQLQISGEDDVADGDPVVRGTTLVQPLADVTPGDYEVLWRVTSSDGHPISGSLAFTVEGREPAATDEDETPEPAAGATQGSEETGEDTTEATEPVQDEPVQEVTPQVTDQGGLPVWAWAVAGGVLLGLAALLARTWSRGRS